MQKAIWRYKTDIDPPPNGNCSLSIHFNTHFPGPIILGRMTGLDFYLKLGVKVINCGSGDIHVIFVRFPLGQGEVFLAKP